MRFAILGYGHFGQAFADMLCNAGHAVCIHDMHAEVPPALAAPSLAVAVADAQWIVLAMPVPQMGAALIALRSLLHAGQTVMDVGSVKVHPCALMDQYLGTAIAHVGSHPLFGPLSLARGDRPLRTVICASEQHPQAAIQAAALFTELGCEVIEQDPATHDQHMANTHALTFFLAKGLIDMGVDDDLTVAPPSFQGLKNMLAAVRGDAGHLFAAIQQENPFAAAARGRLLDSLEHIHRELLASIDDEALAISNREPQAAANPAPDSSSKH